MASTSRPAGGHHPRLVVSIAVLLWGCCSAVAPPDPGAQPLGSLAGDWQAHHRGLGHPSDPPAWRAPKHGLALPTANSELGSVIADENILAVRDLTLPPYTQGPWSSVARNVSRLGRLPVGGVPVFTARSRWTPLGFERDGNAGGRHLQSTVRLPLSKAGVLMHLQVGGPSSSGDEVSADLSVGIELVPEVRAYPAAEMNCSEQQWRYPSNMQRNCWNWYAPRSVSNRGITYGRICMLHHPETLHGPIAM
eukprot:SAG11_NODE_2348_length_3485_cov_1.358535_4_plen_250_part_00